jgi:hypothetical protein
MPETNCWLAVGFHGFILSSTVVWSIRCACYYSERDYRATVERAAGRILIGSGECGDDRIFPKEPMYQSDLCPSFVFCPTLFGLVTIFQFLDHTSPKKRSACKLAVLMQRMMEDFVVNRPAIVCGNDPCAMGLLVNWFRGVPISHNAEISDSRSNQRENASIEPGHEEVMLLVVEMPAKLAQETEISQDQTIPESSTSIKNGKPDLFTMSMSSMTDSSDGSSDTSVDTFSELISNLRSIRNYIDVQPKLARAVSKKFSSTDKNGREGPPLARDNLSGQNRSLSSVSPFELHQQKNEACSTQMNTESKMQPPSLVGLSSAGVVPSASPSRKGMSASPLKGAFRQRRANARAKKLCSLGIPIAATFYV